jgi:dihydrofolate reductase
VSCLATAATLKLHPSGSGGLVHTLLRAGLVDELRLLILSVTLGTGKKLFGTGTVPAGWRLASSTATSAGVPSATYQRAT